MAGVYTLPYTPEPSYNKRFNDFTDDISSKFRHTHPCIRLPHTYYLLDYVNVPSILKWFQYDVILLQTDEEQNILLKAGAIDTLAMQLESPFIDVQLPILACLANMCYQNQDVASLLAITTTSKNQGERSVTAILNEMMGRDKNSLIQLEAARCIAYMHRARALTSIDSKVIYKALPCLIRLCHNDRPARERVAAAETLAYLTEVDTDLQRLASISNHSIPTLAEFLKPNLVVNIFQIPIEFL